MKESFYCLRFHILYQVHNSPQKWHCSPALMHSQNLETFTCISFMYIYAPFVHWIYCLDLNMYIDGCSTIRIVMTMNTIIQGRSKHRQGTYGILYEDCSAWDIPFSSAISVCDNYQSFSTILSSAAIAQLVRHWTMGYGLMSGKLRDHW